MTRPLPRWTPLVDVDLTKPHPPRKGQRLRVHLVNGDVAEYLVGDVTEKEGEPGTVVLTLDPIPGPDGHTNGHTWAYEPQPETPC